MYIIGGIVDRNRYQSLTLNKANHQGINHARLPINKHVKLQSSAVLTVNHVFQIIAVQFNTKDWAKTLTEVIPDRKTKVKVKETKEAKDKEEEKSESKEEEKS